MNRTPVEAFGKQGFPRNQKKSYDKSMTGFLSSSTSSEHKILCGLGILKVRDAKANQTKPNDFEKGFPRLPQRMGSMHKF
jgi:hypothetical protein